jgi:methyl-accepting chemotaxis protein
MARRHSEAVEVTVKRSPVTGWLADRTLAAKNAVAVAAMALVAVVVSVISLNMVAEMRNDLAAMKATSVDSLQQVAELRGGIADLFRGMLLVELGQDDAGRKVGRDAVVAADAKIDGAVAAYRTLAADSPGRLQNLTAFAEAMDRYRVLRDTLVFRQAPPAGFTLPAPDQIFGEFQRTEDAMNGAMADLQRTEDSEADALAAAGAEDYTIARAAMIVALVVGILLASIIAYAVIRLIKRQLASVSRALGAVADSNLAVPAEVRSRDELGRMAVAVNRAREGLRVTVNSLTSGATDLGSGTQQLTGVTTRIPRR